MIVLLEYKSEKASAASLRPKPLITKYKNHEGFYDSKKRAQSYKHLLPLR